MRPQYNGMCKGETTLSSFVLFFGLLNALTPVLMLNTSDAASNFSLDQRRIMRNMFVCGVCLIFVGLILAIA